MSYAVLILATCIITVLVLRASEGARNGGKVKLAPFLELVGVGLLAMAAGVTYLAAFILSYAVTLTFYGKAAGVLAHERDR